MTIKPQETLSDYRSTEGAEGQALTDHSLSSPRYLSLKIPTGAAEPYANLTPAKRTRYLGLWHRAVFRTKIERALKKVSEEILVYGTSNELLDHNMLYRANIDELIEKKSKKQEDFRKMDSGSFADREKHAWLLHPDSMFVRVWNIVLTTILMYTAIIMPYRIAFEPVIFWDAWTIIEFTIDGLFFLDVVINFFCMYYKTSGRLVSSRLKIMKHYLAGWFMLDFVACLPFSLVDYFDAAAQAVPSQKYNNMLRLARVPRMYKLFRVTRILKAFRHYKDHKFLEKIQDCLQLNSRLYKLIKFLFSVLLCVHIAGCFWYFAAKVYDFGVNTWVTRYGYADEDNMTQYILSIYWAVTTVTTVGYGDIAGKTELEMVLCVVWMFIGVGFYSFTVGSLSSFLTSIDTRESVLSAKMAAIQEFSKETGISPECRLKVRNAIRYHTYKQGTVWSDKHSLFNELPKALRFEVVSSMYNGIYKEFPFFAKKDPSFTIFVMPLFKPLKINNGDYLYREKDYSDEVYFTTRGRVNFVVKGSEIVYKSYLRGSYIGEIEVIRKIPRLNNAICYGECEFLVLTKKDFMEVLEEFPNEKREVVRVANERARRNKQSLWETMELVQLKAQKGNIRDLAGHDRVMEVTEDVANPHEDSNSAK